jgi:hypothetical protein
MIQLMSEKVQFKEQKCMSPESSSQTQYEISRQYEERHG